MNQDAEHLRLLSIFHYVVGAIAAFFACLPIFYMIVGIAILSNDLDDGSNGVPAIPFGLMFIAVSALFIIMGWAFAICLFLAGRYLARRQHHLFCLIVAGVSCAFVPFGTVLGVFGIIVLERPSVKAQFAYLQAEKSREGEP